MSNTVILVGAEEVSRAGSAISHAAQEMRRTAASYEETAFRQRQFMEQWLQDFRTILEEHKK